MTKQSEQDVLYYRLIYLPADDLTLCFSFWYPIFLNHITNMDRVLKRQIDREHINQINHIISFLLS